jgi:homoserine dehydrogenase
VTPLNLSIVLVGYGHVARRFVELLAESSDRLATLGIETRICGAITRRCGGVLDDDGFDAPRLESALSQTMPNEGGSVPFIEHAVATIHRRPYAMPIVIEATTLDVATGEPAISHVRAALGAGADVITANKGPVACAYRELAAEADRADRSFLFEGAVMDGIPVFGLVRESMPACEIRGFRGVVNSTTNFILDAMERGETFEAALTRMQRSGVTEADPSLDVDGWDAAAKAAALANVWLDARTSPARVTRAGITSADGARAQAARAAGRRLKLVASARRPSEPDGPVDVRVALQELDASDPLAILDDQANAIEIDTWPLGRVVITQLDGGLEKTAYALLADLITIARRHRVRSGPA